MTKTTNFEISKKLKEIGFKKETEFFLYLNEPYCDAWHISEEGQILANKKDDCLPSYNLETLLDALPKSMKYCGDTYYFWMTYSGSSDCYIIGYSSGQLRKTELEKSSKENESLVDIAGRLIILLHEKNLIKF
jgi:hypothetical protein